MPGTHMKTRTRVILVAALLLAVAALSSMKRGVNSDGTPNGGACCPLMAALNLNPLVAGTNQIITNATPQQVIAYYFHGTVRCETCLKLEQQAKAVIEQQFSDELAANRLAFKSVNYDLPENAHFLLDYKLPCPSLVLVRQKDGQDGQWKLLNDTWQLVENPVKFNGYI